MPQRKLISSLPGIQDQSSQPIPQSRRSLNSRVIAIDVLLNKVRDFVQLLKVSARSTRHVGDITVPPERIGFAACVFKPKLDDERVNCGLS
jgi:hypothetical protein